MKNLLKQKNTFSKDIKSLAKKALIAGTLATSIVASAVSCQTFAQTDSSVTQEVNDNNKNVTKENIREEYTTSEFYENGKIKTKKTYMYHNDEYYIKLIKEYDIDGRVSVEKEYEYMFNDKSNVFLQHETTREKGNFTRISRVFLNNKVVEYTFDGEKIYTPREYTKNGEIIFDNELSL